MDQSQLDELLAKGVLTAEEHATASARLGAASTETDTTSSAPASTTTAGRRPLVIGSVVAVVLVAAVGTAIALTGSNPDADEVVTAVTPSDSVEFVDADEAPTPTPSPTATPAPTSTPEPVPTLEPTLPDIVWRFGDDHLPTGEVTAHPLDDLGLSFLSLHLDVVGDTIRLLNSDDASPWSTPLPDGFPADASIQTLFDSGPTRDELAYVLGEDVPPIIAITVEGVDAESGFGEAAQPVTRLDAFDIIDGTHLWTTELDGERRIEPHGTELLLARQDNVDPVAIDRRTGAVLPHFPAFPGGLFAGTEDHFSFRTDTGEVYAAAGNLTNLTTGATIEGEFVNAADHVIDIGSFGLVATSFDGTGASVYEKATGAPHPAFPAEFQYVNSSANLITIEEDSGPQLYNLADATPFSFGDNGILYLDGLLISETELDPGYEWTFTSPSLPAATTYSTTIADADISIVDATHTLVQTITDSTLTVALLNVIDETQVWTVTLPEGSLARDVYLTPSGLRVGQWLITDLDLTEPVDDAEAAAVETIAEERDIAPIDEPRPAWTGDDLHRVARAVMDAYILADYDSVRWIIGGSTFGDAATWEGIRPVPTTVDAEGCAPYDGSGSTDVCTFSLDGRTVELLAAYDAIGGAWIINGINI